MNTLEENKEVTHINIHGRVARFFLHFKLQGIRFFFTFYNAGYTIFFAFLHKYRALK